MFFHIFWAQSDVMGAVESEINNEPTLLISIQTPIWFRKPRFNLAGNPPTRTRGVGAVRVGKSNPYPYPAVPYP